MQEKSYDLVIVGGGASGMAAAIKAKQILPRVSVAIFERNDILGKKLRTTGNGRGNLSNVNIRTFEETLHFFQSIGILTREDETGRIYPFSESASDCAKLMEHHVMRLGCDVFFGTLVETVEKIKGKFLIQSSFGEVIGKKLILATGGKAGISSLEKQQLMHHDGYTFAEKFGHTIIKTTPVLTGVKVEGMPKSLAGIRAKGQVRLVIEHQDSPIFEEKGEIQFTDYGLSGICIFNLSRFLKYEGVRKLEPYRIEIDLDPKREGKELVLEGYPQSTIQDQPVIQIINGLFKKPLAEYILQCSKIDGKKLFKELNKKDRSSIYHQICQMSFQPVGTMGFQMAQCTAGGVKMSELDSESGASKIIPGLYITGELMDFDGPCGGYNLDHAFRTGILAAKNAVCELCSETLK